jgi:hypothetical protein
MMGVMLISRRLGVGPGRCAVALVAHAVVARAEWQHVRRRHGDGVLAPSSIDQNNGWYLTVNGEGLLHTARLGARAIRRRMV